MRYLIITYILKPGGQSNEVVQINDSITSYHERTANVIMDFKELKIVKARMAEPIPREWNAIYDYYLNIYPGIFEALEDENPQEPK